QYRERLREAHDSARRDAERKGGRKIANLQRLVETAGRLRSEAVERARREAEKSAARNVGQAVRLATRENEAKVEKIEAARQRDNLRHEADRARWQAQVDTLSRKLEKQSGEQLGDEAEVDLFARLKEEFAFDRIERIGRGVKGADLVQTVIDDGK